MQITPISGWPEETLSLALALTLDLAELQVVESVDEKQMKIIGRTGQEKIAWNTIPSKASESRGAET